jgi:tRNA threonylcarbamoyladenosine biosynthesis protein TsaB
MILAFETSCTCCSVALWDKDRIITERDQEIGHGHATVLVPMIVNVLKDANVSFSQITHIATTRGPGSFTGIRVGLATARGFALAGSLPLLGITTFEALWQGAPAEIKKAKSLIAIDTKRGDFYTALFDQGRGSDFQIRTLLEIETICKTQYRALITDQPLPLPGISVFSLLPSAHHVAEYAAQNIHKPDFFSSDPFYLRPPQIHGHPA